MKKNLLLWLAGSIALLASCGSDSTTNEHTNTAPSCKITAPIDGQTYDATLPLVIKGRVSDTESNIAITKLAVNGETISQQLELPFFEYTIAPEKLGKGPLTIDLYAEDEGGLSARHQVTVTLEKAIQLMAGPDGRNGAAFGYWSEETEVRVTASSRWTIAFPEHGWVDVFDTASGEWVTKKSLSGQGETTIRLRAKANDQFDDRIAQLRITTAEDVGIFTLEQKASPDMLELIEDENLRIAASVSIIIYEMDPNEDGKISAFEAEIKPGERDPYGFDAGAYLITSTKGIENFPHLRHLDLNRNEDLTEIDLSGNPDLMSIHVNGCTKLKNLDLSNQPLLIELGCDYGLYLTIEEQVKKLKKQMHTLGILNRLPDQPSTLDFTGFSNLQRLYIYDNALTEVKLQGCNLLWRLSAAGNAFPEIDLSEVDRLPENDYHMENNPNLKRIYVWKGFTPDYYYSFTYDKENGVEIIEK